MLNNRKFAKSLSKIKVLCEEGKISFWNEFEINNCLVGLAYKDYSGQDLNADLGDLQNIKTLATSGFYTFVLELTTNPEYSSLLDLYLEKDKNRALGRVGEVVRSLI